MFKKLSLLTLVLGLSFSAFAGELDNDNKTANQEITGAVVVRVNNQTGEVAYLSSDKAITSNTEANKLADTGKFEVVGNDHLKSELDRDAAASSWYWYYGNYYYSYMYWYGNYYYPYYTYNYGYYNYYYYCHRGW